MTVPGEAERQLLEEGLESYVPAASAIFSFRELVQSRVRQVMEPRLAEFSSALGVPLDKGQLVPLQTPPASQWDGQWAFLGLQLNDVGDAKCWLYLGLYWELGEEGNWITQIWAGLSVRRRDQVERVRKALLPHPSNLSFEEAIKEVWLYEPISRPEMGDFDRKLDDILGQWIELWKRVGGLKKVLPGDSASGD